MSETRSITKVLFSKLCLFFTLFQHVSAEELFNSVGAEITKSQKRNIEKCSSYVGRGFVSNRAITDYCKDIIFKKLNTYLMEIFA